MSALSPADRRPARELPAESQQEQDPDADSVQCWALPTATSTQQFALTTAEPSAEPPRLAHSAGAQDGAPAAPAAVKHLAQPLMPHPAPPAPQLQDAGSTAAHDETQGITCDTESAAAAMTNKDTHPQLAVEANHIGDASLPIRTDGTAQHARTL
jgi:hypothetical protein